MQRNPSESKLHTDLIKMMLIHFNGKSYGHHGNWILSILKNILSNQQVTIQSVSQGD